MALQQQRLLILFLILLSAGVILDGLVMAGPEDRTTAKDQSCSDNSTNCITCLNSDCVWTVNQCLASCEILDVACYQPSDDNVGTCAQVAMEEADLAICSPLNDCSDCTSTLVSDGVNTCKWYSMEEDANGYCGIGGCDFNGVCGSMGCSGQSLWTILITLCFCA